MPRKEAMEEQKVQLGKTCWTWRSASTTWKIWFKECLLWSWIGPQLFDKVQLKNSVGLGCALWHSADNVSSPLLATVSTNEPYSSRNVWQVRCRLSELFPQTTEEVVEVVKIDLTFGCLSVRETRPRQSSFGRSSSQGTPTETSARLRCMR